MKDSTNAVIFLSLAIPFGLKASIEIKSVAGEWLIVISAVFLMVSSYYLGKWANQMDAVQRKDGGKN